MFYYKNFIDDTGKCDVCMTVGVPILNLVNIDDYVR